MRLRRLAELRRADWLVLVQLVPIAAATRLALRRLPLLQLVQGHTRLELPPRLQLPLFVSEVDERRLYQLADWATRLLGGNTPCLTRSLVLHRMLRRRGEPSVIALGVMKVGGALRAHAWVTRHGQPVGESEATLAKFTQLAQLGAS